MFAELVSAVSIVASLIFVGIQVQQSSVTAEAQTRATLTTITHDMISVQMTPEWGEISTRLRNGEPLPPELQWIRNMYTTMQFRTGENVFYQHRVGTFSDEEFLGYRNFYRDYFSSSFVRNHWENTKHRYSPIFQREVALLIDEIQANIDDN